MKKISVIIPCYNVSEYIDRCMMSIENQTFGIGNLEIILVDDASTDNTPDKLKEWEAKLPENIIVILNDINGRQGKARNIGLSYASCDWIAFIDSDDWIEPTYFERLYNAAEGNDCDMALCCLKEDASGELKCFENTKTGKEDALITLNSSEKVRQILVSAIIHPYVCGKLIKKKIIEEKEIIFPENLTYEDTFWSAILNFYVKKVYFCEEFLYHYCFNYNSTVLTNNADHHIDTLTIHMLMWKEYLKRGLYSEYKDEIEYNFLYTCYLGFIKMLALRYSTPNFSHFNLMKRIVLERVSDYKNNRYIKNGYIKEFHLALLGFLDVDVDKDSFLSMIEAVKKSGM